VARGRPLRRDRPGGAGRGRGRGGGPALCAGVFATTGALAASLAPQPDALRDRLRRIAAATGFGGIGLLVGQFTSDGDWEAVAVIALLSVVAALVSAINAALASGLVTPLGPKARQWPSRLQTG
jgi:hypothetical protein